MKRISLPATLAACTLASAGMTVRSISAATSSKLPYGTVNQAVMVVRIANPRLLRGRLQWMAGHIFIPGVIPSIKSMEGGMEIPGGIQNSKPVRLLIMPTGQENSPFEPILILSASNPQLAVSRLNPPAPVNGISMVMMKNGASGYVALRKNAVLFATHREPLRMVLHHPNTVMPPLAGRADRIFMHSDMSFYVNMKQFIRVLGPKISKALAALRQGPTLADPGLQQQTEIDSVLVNRLVSAARQNCRFMVTGIRVAKKGLMVQALGMPRAQGPLAKALVSLIKVHLSSWRQIPNLPLAAAVRGKVPASWTNAVAQFYSVPGLSGPGLPRSLDMTAKLLSFLARHPDGKYQTSHSFLLAPVSKNDPIEAILTDCNTSKPQKVCDLMLQLFKKQYRYLATGGQTAGMLKVTMADEHPLTVDGITFQRMAVRWEPGPAIQKMGMYGRAAGVGMKDALAAMLGGDTLQIAVGHLGNHVIEAIDARPAQLRQYIRYLRGYGTAVPKNMLEAQTHFLSHAFAEGFFDPAVELGQLNADVSADSGMMEINNPVSAGETPAWAMSANCMNGKPEFKLFIPTQSLRVSSQQLHRMVGAFMMLVMQVEHPAKGA
jgi:hypothetical protein